MISSTYQNINQRSKLGFTQNIKFSTYDVVRDSAVKMVGESKMGNGRSLSTFKVMMCNAGGVVGGDVGKNLMYHLYSRRFFADLTENLLNLNKTFKETIALLKKEKKRPQGLIFGGESQNEGSKDLMVILKYFFDKFKIDYSIFWGNKDLTHHDKWFEKNIHYKGMNNTWLANLRISGKKGINRDISDKKSVLDAFEYILLSRRDNVKFSDTDWIRGKDGSLNKGHIDLTIEDVLKKYGIDPKILESL